MKLARAILSSNKGRIILGLAACWLGWQAWLTIAARGKIAGDFPGSRERVNILVTLSFPPERFHVLVFQKHGRVSGTIDNAIEVRNVKKTDLSAVARPYWVRRIEPLQQGS